MRCPCAARGSIGLGEILVVYRICAGSSVNTPILRIWSDVYVTGNVAYNETNIKMIPITQSFNARWIF